MDLLEVSLPQLRLRIEMEPPSFFDDCEEIAAVHGWRIDRRPEYAAVGYDQLNLYIGPGRHGYPMVRMVATPGEPRRLRVDVVDDWRTSPLDYDEYLDAARAAYGTLLDEYKKTKGKRYRLGIPRRPVAVDYTALDCGPINSTDASEPGNMTAPRVGGVYSPNLGRRRCRAYPTSFATTESLPRSTRSLFRIV